MKNDFIALFKGVDKAEQLAFEQYIAHFYKKQKAVLQTFGTVVKALDNKEEDTALSIIQNNKKMLNDLSDLKQFFLEFLAVQEAKTNSYEARFLTLEALRKRQLKGFLAKKTAELRTELATDLGLNMRQSLMKLSLDHEAYFNTENDKLGNVKGDIDLLMDGLDNFYIAAKLRYGVESLHRSAIFNEQFQPRLLSEILTLLATDNSLNPLIYGIYLPLMQLVTDKSETAYDALKAFLLDDTTHDALEKLAILMYLFNFAAYRIRQHDKHYQQEALKLAQIGIDQSLFIAAGHFPTRTFNNIVNVGCFNEQYEWTAAFVDNWAKHLTPNDAEIAGNLAKARIHFAKKNYTLTIDLLLKLINHKNTHFSIDIRALLARAYYEQNTEKSTQNNHCDAFELYIYRHKKIDDTLRKSVFNFIKILRLLIDNNETKAKMLEVLDSFLHDGQIMLLDWLTAKINASNQ
jgi:hypothetical protein